MRDFMDALSFRGEEFEHFRGYYISEFYVAHLELTFERWMRGDHV